MPGLVSLAPAFFLPSRESELQPMCIGSGQLFAMKLGTKITARLLLGFAAMLLLVLGLSYASLTTVDRLGASLDSAVNAGARKLQLTGEIRAGFEEMRADAGKVEMSSVNMLVGDLETHETAAGLGCSSCHTKDDVTNQKQRFDTTGDRLKEKIGELRPLITGESEARVLDTMLAGVNEWRTFYEKYLTLTWQHHFVDAHDIMLQKLYPLMEGLNKAADQLLEQQTERLEGDGLAAQDRVSQSRALAFLLIGLCLVAGGGVYWTVRGVNGLLR